MLVAQPGLRRGTAGKGYDGFPVLFGKSRHSYGSLAHYGLSIQPPFAGNDQGGFFYVLLQFCFPQHDIYARLQGSFCVGQEGKAQPSGGACSGSCRVGLGVFGP